MNNVHRFMVGFYKKLKFYFKYFIIIWNIYNVPLQTLYFDLRICSKILWTLSGLYIIHFLCFSIDKSNVPIQWPMNREWKSPIVVRKSIARFFFSLWRREDFRFSNQCTLHIGYGSINIDVRLHSLQNSNLYSSFKPELTLFGQRL